MAIVISSCVATGFPVTPAAAAGCDENKSIAEQAGSQDEVPWPMRMLRPERAWPVSRGEGVVVAVIDSGVAADHPALKGRVLDGKDYVSGSKKGKCDESDAAHGTFVAGAIAGSRRGEDEYYGVAPKAKILPVRYNPGTEDGKWDPADTSKAIRWAADHGADVINMSFRQQPGDDLEKAVKYAHKKGVVLVGVAGNVGDPEENEEQPEPSVYPAAYDEVIGVAGVTRKGGHSKDSVTGKHVSIAAPSEQIPGPVPGGGYLEAERGTSFAAGYVSGTAALILSRFPKLSPDEVAERMYRTASNGELGRDDDVGYGIVNPYRAVTSMSDAGAVGPRTDREGIDPAATGDPHASATLVAVIVAAAAVVVVASLLWGRAMVAHRRGRGEERAAPRAVAAAVKREFEPVLGTRMRLGGVRTRRSGATAGSDAQPGK